MARNTVWIGDLREEVLKNTDYRRSLHTTPYDQIVVMCITAEDEGIEQEMHPYTTQTLEVESGEGVAIVDGERFHIGRDTPTLRIPPGSTHEILLKGSAPLKLASYYSPPQHPHDAVEKRRF